MDMPMDIAMNGTNEYTYQNAPSLNSFNSIKSLSIYTLLIGAKMKRLKES